MKVYKSIIVPMKVSKEDYEYICKLNKYSAEVWNLCLELERKHREENEGKWIDRSTLQKLTKKCVPLHAKGIHHVVHKFLYARDAALAAKKGDGENILFPYRQKRYFVTGWDSQVIKIKDNEILLTRAQFVDNDGKVRNAKPIRMGIKSIPENIAQVEIIYKNGYKFCIKYLDKSQYLQFKNGNVAAIDLGEIHSITSVDNIGNSIIITGRKMRSIKQERNKLQSELYAKMSRCKKGSIQYNNYKKALRKLKYDYDNKILDCTHKITKKYLDFCLLNNITTVYYGDLDSVTRSTKGRVRKNIGQKLQQFNHGEITRQLENKLSRYGIEMIKVKEYYTSQKCPKCKEMNKPEGRRYVCSYCDYRQHRDVVGAMNILNDNAGENITYYKNLKYLRID